MIEPRVTSCRPYVDPRQIMHITRCYEDAICGPDCPDCDIALCGEDLTTHPWVRQTVVPCPICHHLEQEETG